MWGGNFHHIAVSAEHEQHNFVDLLGKTTWRKREDEKCERHADKSWEGDRQHVTTLDPPPNIQHSREIAGITIITPTSEHENNTWDT